MNWMSFFSGVTTVFITYALFSHVLEMEQEEIAVDEEAGEVVNCAYLADMSPLHVKHVGN
jgi:hypothetical protein